MSETPLISIIIPTYNRAHLIGETLDSVIAQTYKNWECIVVDDGSSDNSVEILQAYTEKDSRIKYFKRPKEYQPGGNGARNYGFGKSKGEFIQWFDSDDLMVIDKIEKKVNAIIDKPVDFVISKTKYFNQPAKRNKKSYDYNYTVEEVNFLSYATSAVNWFTPDIFVTRQIADKIKFNEKLKAGQEYNFSCKLLLLTHNMFKIDEFLTLRRYHLESIGRKRQLDKSHYWKTNFKLHWYNFLELNRSYELPVEFKKFALLKCIFSYLNCEEIKIPFKFHQYLFSVFKGRASYFYLANISRFIFNKYQFFYNNLK